MVPLLFLLLLFHLPLSLELVTSEYHSQVFFINVPVNATLLNGYINDIVMIDTYNGFAWITLECYHLDYVKLSTPLGWVDLHTAGWTVKTIVSVSYKGQYPGQYILDLDTDNSLTGSLEYLGCETQYGINCYSASVISRTTTNSSVDQVLISEGATLTANFSIGTSETDIDFVAWIINHLSNKYTGKVGGKVYLSKNSGNPPTSPTSTLHVNSLVMNMISVRFGIDVENICDNNECFLAPDISLLESSGDEIGGEGKLEQNNIFLIMSVCIGVVISFF